MHASLWSTTSLVCRFQSLPQQVSTSFVHGRPASYIILQLIRWLICTLTRFAADLDFCFVAVLGSRSAKAKLSTRMLKTKQDFVGIRSLGLSKCHRGSLTFKVLIECRFWWDRTYSLLFLIGCSLWLPKRIKMNESTISDENSISGYLYKRTRDNRWQKRWFETNGVYLTYYKSRKAEKLLAALSLPQVGDIRLISAASDPEHLDGLFSLELNNRVYVLRAKSNEEAALWVNMLGKLREDGIHATTNPTTAGLTIHGSPESSPSKGGAQQTGKSEWIKSGKSCFGCC